MYILIGRTNLVFFEFIFIILLLIITIGCPGSLVGRVLGYQRDDYGFDSHKDTGLLHSELPKKSFH